MLESISLTLAVDDDYDGPALPQPSAPPQPAETREGQPATEGDTPAPVVNGRTDDVGFPWLLPMLLLGLLLWIVLVFRGQSKERKKQQAMLTGLKKGDKVQTVGGIIGTLVELRDDEVLVKVDENANTRLRFARNAIKTVLDSKDEKQE